MKYEKVFLLMNEQHSLLEDQKRVLEEHFGDAEIERISVPAKGWTLEEMDQVVREMYLELVQAAPKFPNNKDCYTILGYFCSVQAAPKFPNNPKKSEFYNFTYGRKPTAVVFLSPIPYMIKKLSQLSMSADMDGSCTFVEYDVFVFHNDNREKKELPNGKIVYTVAQNGWQLV